MNATDGPSVWYSLLLVGFGGIFGVFVSQFVTWLRDRAKSKAEKKSKLHWLLAEIIDNLEHIERYSLAGGRAKVKLLTQVWETVKGDSLALNPDLTQSLRRAYAEVWRFNCIVEYDLEKVPPGNGMLNGALEVKAGEVKTALSDSQMRLSSHLGL